MKSVLLKLSVAVAISIPFVSFAQSNAPLTRAQVRAELAQLQAAGYNPARATDPWYPWDIEAAEARLRDQRTAVAQSDSGHGTTTGNTSAAGR